MAQQKAAAQLGTVGSGNYYVDLLRDDDGLVWIGVHFGKRTRTAGDKNGMNVPPALIERTANWAVATSRRWSSRGVMPTRGESRWWSECVGAWKMA
jgi:hypothetical protein